MVSVIWKKRALPIYWLLLNKKGSSNFYEQVATIKPRYKKYQSLNSLNIKPGSRVSYNGVLVTEDNKKE